MNTSKQSAAQAAELCGGKPEKTRQILDAALEAFLAMGYGAVSMDAIAARAGVSKATVYTRFPSKEQLFAAVVSRECDACARRMCVAECSPALDLASALRRVAQELMDMITLPRNLAILRLVIAEEPRFPELGTAFYESGPAVMLRNLAGFLTREHQRGQLQIDDAAVAAQHLVSLLRGDLQIRALLGAGDVSDGARELAAGRAVEAFLRIYGRSAAPKEAEAAGGRSV